MMEKEIGSFIELDLRDTGEYYNGETNVARLSTGRSAILHSIILQKTSQVYIPYYLCSTVKEILTENGIEIIPYYINDNFEPLLKTNSKSSSFLLVNYFGILSHKRLVSLSKKYQNVIIDNCPAFFNPPIEGCYNVYSARKFFGVPDGSYVLGHNASAGILKYQRDSSSETAAFLLKRIEKGSSAVYSERMQNEERLDKSETLQMSVLTKKLLTAVDYDAIRVKRIENFRYLHSLISKYNLLDPLKFMDNKCVPLVYPLLVKDSGLVNKLRDRKIYTGRWWNHVLKEVDQDSFEAFLSRFMVPVPVDQRYGKDEINYIFNTFKEVYKPE
jgi:hypothetical protein